MRRLLRPRYLAIGILLLTMLVAAVGMSTAAYFGARDANTRITTERAESIRRNCERGNSTNRGVLNFIAATLQNSKPLVAPVTGNAELDDAIHQILGQVNTNTASRNEAIADAQRRFFPLVNCMTGKVLPP